MEKLRMRNELKKYLVNHKIIFWQISIIFLFSIIISLYYPMTKDFLKIVSSIQMTLSAGLLAFIISGFAIVITINKRFTLFVIKIDYKKNTNHLEELLFPFWFTALLWASLLLISFISFLWGHSQCFFDLIFSFRDFSIQKNMIMSRFLFSIIITIMLFALYYTVQLIGNIYKIGILEAKTILNDSLKESNKSK